MAKVRYIELNTVSNPFPGFRDESPRLRCSKCGNYLLLGRGMDQEDELVQVANLHINLCEGDLPVTLWKMDQFLKSLRDSRGTAIAVALRNESGY